MMVGCVNFVAFVQQNAITTLLKYEIKEIEK